MKYNTSQHSQLKSERENILASYETISFNIIINHRSRFAAQRLSRRESLVFQGFATAASPAKAEQTTPAAKAQIQRPTLSHW